MKPTVKELLKSNYPEVLYKYCQGCIHDETCPFPKDLLALREDSFCILECIKYVDDWIETDKYRIKQHQWEIERLENKIKKYEKFKKLIEEYKK